MPAHCRMVSRSDLRVQISAPVHGPKSVPLPLHIVRGNSDIHRGGRQSKGKPAGIDSY
jgi:hypothetical protein